MAVPLFFAGENLSMESHVSLWLPRTGVCCSRRKKANAHQQLPSRHMGDSGRNIGNIAERARSSRQRICRQLIGDVSSTRIGNFRIGRITGV